MKNLFRKHPDIFLVGLAIIFLVLIISCFSWGIGDVVVAVNAALKNPAPPTSQGFDLHDAANLDLRGLLQQ